MGSDEGGFAFPSGSKKSASLWYVNLAMQLSLFVNEESKPCGVGWRRVLLPQRQRRAVLHLGGEPLVPLAADSGLVQLLLAALDDARHLRSRGFRVHVSGGGPDSV